MIKEAEIPFDLLLLRAGVNDCGAASQYATRGPRDKMQTDGGQKIPLAVANIYHAQQCTRCKKQPGFENRI